MLALETLRTVGIDLNRLACYQNRCAYCYENNKLETIADCRLFERLKKQTYKKNKNKIISKVYPD